MITSTSARRIVAAVALMAVCAMPVGAQDELVVRGNVAYQEGDFTSAIEAYESVLAGGFSSAGLEYNLGNAYFKSGDLARSILHWERARLLAPSDDDVIANLELARSLTVDAIEPLPTFWLVSAVAWWVDLLPRGVLIAVVAAGWLCLGGGAMTRILARTDSIAAVGRWAAIGGAVVVVLLGSNLLVRELGIGRPERAVIMSEAVSVRSAPAMDDDLVLFEIHEGTRVRIDERTPEWAEVVLDDGKVGWIPLGVMEAI